MTDHDLQKLIEVAIHEGWTQGDDGEEFHVWCALDAIMAVIAKHRPEPHDAD